MKKMMLTIALCSTSLLSYAGGPDNMSNDNSLTGLSVGIQGGIGLVDSSLSTNYTGSTETDPPAYRETSATNTVTNFTGIYGANIAWAMQFTHNMLSFVFSYNQLTNNIKTSTFFVGTATPDGNDDSLLNNTTLQHQYDLGIDFKHFIAANFDASLDVGASVLKINNSFKINNEAATPRGPGTSNSSYLIGGYLGVGGEYFTSRHTSFDANINYFVYKTQDLKTLYGSQVVTGSNGTLVLARKLQISIPEITFGFNYYI